MLYKLNSFFFPFECRQPTELIMQRLWKKFNLPYTTILCFAVLPRPWLRYLYICTAIVFFFDHQPCICCYHYREGPCRDGSTLSFCLMPWSFGFAEPSESYVFVGKLLDTSLWLRLAVPPYNLWQRVSYSFSLSLSLGVIQRPDTYAA